MLQAWIIVLLARCGAAALDAKWPLNLELSPKQSGMQGLRNVYAVDVTVGRVGPLTLLVDTGSPGVVVQGDFGGSSGASTSFLGTDSAGSTATIHYGGATVTGTISRSRMCFDSAKKNTADSLCLADFPVFEIQQQDSGFSQLGLDGVLGLGPVPGEKSLKLDGMDETVLDGVAKSGMPRIFGLYISPGGFFGPSQLSLGGYDNSKILPGVELQYVPLAQPSTGRWELGLQAVKLAPADGSDAQAVDVCQGRSDCRVLLDSGTAQLASTEQLLEALGGSIRSSSGDCIDIKSMPDLHLEFAGGVIVKLGPEDYVLDRQVCSLAIEEFTSEELSRQKSLALILGEPFLQKVYTVFDQEKGQVGLAPSVAMQSQLTRNEQRRREKKQEQEEEGRANLLNYLR